MIKNLRDSYKKSIVLLTIILTVVFLLINVAFYIINNNYLVDKVEEENTAFLRIITHLINDNDVDIALEYIEHYVHIHEVEVGFLDENGQLLFSSYPNHVYSSEYTISTYKGIFTVYIDNTNSVTVNLIENNILTLNILLIIIYILALISLVYSNKKNNYFISNDLNKVLKLIDENKLENPDFNYSEFEHIYEVISKYLENIDMLTEQKEMNMKGLAHDIKTPLTIIYAYFNKVLKNKKIEDEEAKNAFKAAENINELLNDLLGYSNEKNFKNIAFSKVLNEKLSEFESVLNTKDIKLSLAIEEHLEVFWNERDFARIIENLVSNAFHYSNQNSELIIKAYKNEKIHLIFTSEASNLEALDTTKIFEKGYRSNSQDNKNAYGEGLGLYICKLLLTPLNGTITAEKQGNKIIFEIII